MSALNKQFGKVAVAMGGWSAEREVSLNSGKAILTALLNAGVDAHGVDFKKKDTDQIKSFDRVFNILHGRGGEDGVVQGLFEYLELPYTGTGVLGSALAMDKVRTKDIWVNKGLRTPAYKTVKDVAECEQAIKVLGLPVIVKPVLEGSSIGISKVQKLEDIKAAFELANNCNSEVLIEKWVVGEEYTVSILNGKALPAIRLRTPNQFYDFEAKYMSDSTEYLCPCGLSQEKENELAGIALKAFDAISGYGWGRVDFMIDDNKTPWLIEANTVPGMTDHSLVPMSAKQAGYSFESLVVEILKTSMDRNV